MKLKEDLTYGEDFTLVNQVAWQKLIRAFGGAPELGFYLVDKNLLDLPEDKAILKENGEILKD